MAGAFDARPISLEGMLLAREGRVARQREMLSRHKSPIISFTLNIPGEIKSSPKLLALHDYGIAKIKEATELYQKNEEIVTRSDTGPEYMASIDGNAFTLKVLMVNIEESSPLMRLFDIDVIDENGNKLSRGSERTCLLCDKPAFICSRSRSHTKEELCAKISELIDTELIEVACGRVKFLAHKALIDEVSLTPKPGLVDKASRGSHSDMDYYTFINSADAIAPYFEECFRIGVSTADLTPAIAFSHLRAAGLLADEKMLRATGGINTHRGAIYSFGIIIGAYARLWQANGHVDEKELFALAAKLCEDAVREDLMKATGRTHGEELYLKTGITGIRGEAMGGFRSISDIALPTYREMMKSSDKNTALTKTLLTLIASVEDSTLYHRGGVDGALFAKNYATRVLGNGDFSKEAIKRMDTAFIERNLSPGGSADLLALTLFISDMLVP